MAQNLWESMGKQAEGSFLEWLMCGEFVHVPLTSPAPACVLLRWSWPVTSPGLHPLALELASVGGGCRRTGREAGAVLPAEDIPVKSGASARRE